MAFNFMTGNNNPYTNFTPNNYQAMSADPRRRSSMGSFDAKALNFSPMQTYDYGQPSTSPYGQPMVAPPPAPSTSYRQQAGAPSSPSSPLPPQVSGAPVVTPGGSPQPGNYNYGQYSTVQDVYAAFGAEPSNWDWGAWAQATGNPDPRYHTASGDPTTFTWNPNGPGYWNPFTNETFDRPGETYPLPPTTQPPYTGASRRR